MSSPSRNRNAVHEIGENCRSGLVPTPTPPAVRDPHVSVRVIPRGALGRTFSWNPALPNLIAWLLSPRTGWEVLVLQGRREALWWWGKQPVLYRRAASSRGEALSLARDACEALRTDYTALGLTFDPDFQGRLI